MEEIRWVDQNGWLINRVSISNAQFPAVALHRAGLQSTLLHELAPASIHLGHQLINQKQQGDKMIATFANGRSIEADFLIGADGIHSRVRAQLINDGEPVDRGYTIWRGIAAKIPSEIPPSAAVEFHGRGKRFGIGPVGLGRVGWWASANGSITDDVSHDRPSNKTWGRGRMTLLGDAIHPTTPNLGQGGCLAIEDAFVLARCFGKFGATEEALRNYERSRYTRTSALATYSRYYGIMGQWENIWARALRRTTLALAPEALSLRLMQIVFDYDAYL